MLKKIKVSIFFKLIITVIITLVVMDISIMMVLNILNSSKPRKIFPHYVRRMERMIVNDIGYPPDTVKARNIAEDLDMNIRFQSRTFNWTTSQDIPTIEEIESSEEFKGKPPPPPNQPPPEHFALSFNGKRYSVIKSPMGIYILQQTLVPIDLFNPELLILLLVCVVSVILVILYFVLRWLFRPLKKLSAAVDEVGKGNFDINVPVETADELGDLANSLNDMASGIKSSMKSKEQLLIDVSHELRSPLTRIKLGLEVGSPKDKINEDVREMERMITGLLENYRADSEHYKLKIEKIDVAAIIRQVIGEYNGNERVSFTAGAKGESRRVYVNADYERMKLVLRNVIDNALKYSSGKVEINLSENKDNVLISVIDKGVGISEEDLKYIFEPFYRSDPSRSRRTGGFGLGLSICKKVMDAHKGKIEISSRVNEGTEVVITFPK